MGLDDIFGIHEQALKIRGQRAQMLATNLANAETPDYKARDMDFKSALALATGEATALHRTHEQHLADDESFGDGAVKYRNPYQSAIDGNTVDPHVERVEFARNAMQYQASLQFISGKISGLLTALKGE